MKLNKKTHTPSPGRSGAVFQHNATVLGNFTNQLNTIIDKSAAALKKPGSDDLAAIRNEILRVRQDFQTYSLSCDIKDEGCYRFGQLLHKLEGTFNPDQTPEPNKMVRQRDVSPTYIHRKTPGVSKQAPATTQFTRSHEETQMHFHQEKQDLSSFTSRLQSLVMKFDAAMKNPVADNFSTLDYEFDELKRDYQTLSGKKNGPHEQGLFQFGQVLAKFERTFNENSPLRYV